MDDYDGTGFDIGERDIYSGYRDLTLLSIGTDEGKKIIGTVLMMSINTKTVPIIKLLKQCMTKSKFSFVVRYMKLKGYSTVLHL
jgi:hypothetical protein